eukprot:gene5408-6084_t
MEGFHANLRFLAIALFFVTIANANTSNDEVHKKGICTYPVDIGFVVDASGSISAKNYQLQKDFIKRIVRMNHLSKEGVHAGVVLFSQTSSTAIKLNEYYNIDEFNEGVQRLKHEYSITRIDRGLKTAYDQLYTKGYGSRYNVSRVLFLLTDGKQTKGGDYIEPSIAALPLHQIGIQINAIGIGSGPDRKELEEITRNKDSVFLVPNFNALVNLKFLEHFDYACQPDKLKPSAPPPTTKPVTPSGGKLVNYVVALDITNNDNRNIVFKYNHKGQQNQFTVATKSKRKFDLTIPSRTYPLPLVFKAYDEVTGELISLRDRKQLHVIPRRSKVVEYIVLEPNVAEAFINLDIDNRMNEDITVIWQQQGLRKSVNVRKNSKVAKEIVFDRTKGLSPVDFRAITTSKNLAVRLNGRYEVTITPTIVKRKNVLIARKGVFDFYVVLDIINEVSGPITVAWKQDGVAFNTQVEHKGRKSKEIVFRDRVKAPFVELIKGSLAGSTEPVTLNRRSTVRLRATRSKVKRRLIARKNYFVDVDIESQVADDVVLNWKENGVSKSLELPSGQKKSRSMTFSGPTANRPLKFTATIKNTNHRVMLNGKDLVEITPTPAKQRSKLVATKQYTVDANVLNVATGDIVVKVTSKKGVENINVKQGATSKVQIVQDGLQAKTPVTLTALLERTNAPIRLNGKDSVNLIPTPVKEEKEVVASELYFLDLEIVNKAPGAVVVMWKDNQRSKSVEIDAGLTKNHSIVLEGPDANKAITFQAITKGNAELVKVNDGDSVVFAPSSSKTTPKKIVITQPFYLDVEVVNNVPSDIVVSWKENGKDKSLDVKQGETSKQEIVLHGPNSEKPVEFKAVKKGTNVPVKLNGQDKVAVNPSSSKGGVYGMIATAPYYLDVEVVNNVPSDIVVSWKENGKDKSLDVKQGETSKQEIVLHGPNSEKPVEFKAVKKGTNVPVKLNGQDKVAVNPSSSKGGVYGMIATAPYYLDVEVVNNVPSDIVVSWKENGKDKSLDVKQGETSKQEIVLHGPNSEKPVEFKAVKKGTNVPVKLNGQDKVAVNPSSSKGGVYGMIATAPYYLDVEVVNNVPSDIVVSWKENGKDKSLDVKQGETSKQEIVLHGPNSEKPVEFKAVEKGTNDPVKLNGQDKVAFNPSSSKGGIYRAIATAPYYLDVEVVNNVPSDIVVSWKENGKDKSLDVKQGETSKQEIVLHGPNSEKPVEFKAVKKRTNDPVKLNGQDKVAFVPKRSKSVPAESMVASEPKYFISLRAVNKHPVPIVVTWEQNDAPQSLDVLPNSEAKKDIEIKSADKDVPIQFVAFTKENRKPARLNNLDSVELMPTKDKIERTVVAHAPKMVTLEFVNKASSPVTVYTKDAPDGEKVSVPLNGVMRYPIPLDQLGALALSGKNIKSKLPVQLNGFRNLKFDVGTESGKKIIRVIIEDRICSLAVDIGFVLDASGSILPKQYKLQKQFVSQVASMNNISISGAHVGVVLFSQTSSLPIKFSDYYNRTDFKSGVDKLKHECSITRIDKGLKLAYDKMLTKSYGARDGVPKVLFLVTDGKQTRRYNYIEPRVVAEPLRQNGVHIKAIGIGRDADRKELESITGNKDNVYLIKYFNQLLDLKFMSNFDFTLKCDDVESTAKYTPTPKENRPKQDYVVALKVKNERDDLIVKWVENGIPKQREVPKNTTENIDMKINKDFYPDPVSFSAADKKTGKPVKLRDRENLLIIPRTSKKVEVVVAKPDTKYAYLLFDVVNKLDEPIVVEWRQNGKKISEKVAGKSTLPKDITIDRSIPGAFSPVKLTGRKEATNEPVTLNDKNEIEITPSIKKEKKELVVKERLPDSYINLKVANNREDDIDVLWKEGEIDKVITVPKTSSRDYLVTFPGQQGAQSTSFNARVSTKGESDAVKLNGKDENTFQPSLTKTVNTLVALPIGKSQYIIADFKNDASGPVSVLWEEDGVPKNVDLHPGETKQVFIVPKQKDSSTPVSFTAKGKGIDSSVLLNGKESVELAPAKDGKISNVVATDQPKYMVVDLKNDASEPITVTWNDNGVNKNVDIQPGKTKRVSIVRKGVDPSGAVSFSAKGKTSGSPVMLNDKEEVILTPTNDKAVQKAVATDLPKFVIADFKNNASEPITVSWQENGAPKTVDVQPGENKQVFIPRQGKDASKPVSFTGKGRDSGVPVLLNGKERVDVVPSSDGRIKKIVATDQPKYLVVNFKNDASEPITVSWQEYGVPKNKDLQPGQTTSVSIVRKGKDASRPISFTAKGKDSGSPVMLNGKEKQVLTPTNDEKPKDIVATDQPKYLVVNFKNDASEPITVSWQEDGVPKSRDLQPGQTTPVSIVRKGKDASRPISFTAKGKDSGSPVMLNGKEKQVLTPTNDEKPKDIVATDQPKYLVVNFKNDASEPITVSWQEDGVPKSRDLQPGQTTPVSIARKGKDASRPISFTAKGKDSGSPVMLNGKEKQVLTPTNDEKPKDIVATDQPKYLVVNFKNDASEPITVSWQEDGVPKSRDLQPGQTVPVSIVRKGKDASRPISFTAKGKDSGSPVMLNGKEKQVLTPTNDEKPKDIVATDQPKYLVVNFKNDASEPITVSWQEDGVPKSRDLQPGETVPVSIVRKGKDASRPISFTAKGKDSGSPVMLNGKEKQVLTPTKDEKPNDIVATDQPKYIVVQFGNKANEPAVVSWIENGNQKTLELPTRQLVDRTIITRGRSLNRPVSFTAKTTRTNRPLRLNGLAMVDIKPSSSKKPVYIEIKMEKATKVRRFIAMDIENRLKEDVILRFQIQGRDAKLRIAALSKRRQLMTVYNDNPVSFTAVNARDGRSLFINRNKQLLLTPTEKVEWQKMIIEPDEKIFVDLKAINRFPVDVTLEWWYGNGMMKLDVAANREIAKVISLPYNLKSGIEFRAFVKGTHKQANVNGRKSFIVEPSQLTKKTIEVIIDSVYFVGYDILNMNPKTALVSIYDGASGKSRDISIQTRQRIRNMMPITVNGKREPFYFSAREQGSNRPLTLNNLKRIEIRPNLMKLYTPMRIDAYQDPKIHYVVLDVKNRIRDDAVISWMINGTQKSQECTRFRRCLIAFEMNGSLKPSPVVFTATSKQNGDALMMNSQSSISVQPLPYKKITNAVIQVKENGNFNRAYVMVHGSNTNRQPAVVEYEYDGVTKSFELQPYGKIFHEVYIPKPSPGQTLVFKAYNKQTKAPLKINGLSNLVFPIKKFRSSVFLMVGKPVIFSGGELKAHECENKKVDVLFIIDDSGTMFYAFQIAKQFAMKIADLFKLSPDGTRVSVVNIASEKATSLYIRFSDYHNNTLFNNAVNNLPYDGRKTRIDLALDLAVKSFKPENGGRPGVPKLVFLISDGRQEPKRIKGRYVNLFRKSMPLYRMATNIVSIGVFGNRRVDVGALQLISKNRQNVYNPGDMNVIVSDIFVKHVFNKYCHV